MALTVTAKTSDEAKVEVLCRSTALLAVNVRCVCGNAVEGVDVTLDATGANGTQLQVPGTTEENGAAMFHFDLTTEALSTYNVAIDWDGRWLMPYSPPVITGGLLHAAHFEVYSCSTPKLFAAVWQINTEKQPSGAPKQAFFKDLSVNQRLAHLVKALKAAETERKKLEDEKHVLGIFAAPEYYFVGATNEGHFLTRDQKDELVSNFGAAVAPYSKFAVFGGTVGWYDTAARTPTDLMTKYLANIDAGSVVLPKNAVQQRKTLKTFMEDVVKGFQDRFDTQDKALRIVHNTMLIAMDRSLYFYDKRFESIDDNDLSQDIPGFKNFPYKDCVFFPGRLGPLMGFRHFDIGVEICADHESGSLYSFGQQTDLHVICSATVSTVDEHFACHDRGYVVQADSQSSGVYSAADRQWCEWTGRIDTQPGTLDLYVLDLS